MITKKEITAKLSVKSNITKAEAEIHITNLLEVLTEELKTNDKIQFTGFGAFLAENKPSSIARNPKTGEVVNVGPKRVVRFKAGELLKKGVN
jgi:nucleoid DNA-binding protein